MATHRIVIGSTSDEAKIAPGIERFCERHPEEAISLHYASADNAPGKDFRVGVTSLFYSRRPRPIIRSFTRNFHPNPGKGCEE
jgi:hypothetical protein